MSTRDRLHRDTENQKIAGVCAGLARYFDIDPVLVRVLFVVFAFVGGGALLAYVLLWWLVDPAPADHWADTATVPEAGSDVAVASTVENETDRAA